MNHSKLVQMFWNQHGRCDGAKYKSVNDNCIIELLPREKSYATDNGLVILWEYDDNVRIWDDVWQATLAYDQSLELYNDIGRTSRENAVSIINDYARSEQ